MERMFWTARRDWRMPVTVVRAVLSIAPRTDIITRGQSFPINAVRRLLNLGQCFGIALISSSLRWRSPLQANTRSW